MGEGPLEFFTFLSTIRYLDPDVPLARHASRVGRSALADDAGNLATALLTLQRTSPEDLDALQSDMRRCLPGLSRIVLDERGGATSAVVAQLEEHGLVRPIDLADASFGTVRLLALLVALHEPNPPQLTIIEEVDHGLHPYALDVLVDRMRAASERTQIIAATHSPTLVNRLTADELIICDRDPETGESIIPALDRSALDDLLERAAANHWRPGEVWFSGVLGGDPA